MFSQLEEINSRPKPFEFYTAADLWADEHISAQMLAYHLQTDSDLSSRRGEFIDQSVGWIASHFNIGSGTRIADYEQLFVIATISRSGMAGDTLAGFEFTSSPVSPDDAPFIEMVMAVHNQTAAIE